MFTFFQSEKERAEDRERDIDKELEQKKSNSTKKNKNHCEVIIFKKKIPNTRVFFVTFFKV